MAFKITELWAFVADNAEGEGVVAFMSGGVFLPMVAADKSRLEALRPHAQQIGMKTNRRIKLIRMHQREDAEIIYEPELAGRA